MHAQRPHTTVPVRCIRLYVSYKFLLHGDALRRALFALFLNEACLQWIVDMQNLLQATSASNDQVWVDVRRALAIPELIIEG
jgi:hypothetical protein